jgi:hypothetical protein
MNVIAAKRAKVAAKQYLSQTHKLSDEEPIEEMD